MRVTRILLCTGQVHFRELPVTQEQLAAWRRGYGNVLQFPLPGKRGLVDNPALPSFQFAPTLRLEFVVDPGARFTH